MSVVHITHDNIVAALDGVTDPSVSLLLWESLKYHPEGFEHVYSYKSQKWDGYNYLYDTKNHTFRRGLLSRVIRLLEGAGHEVRVKSMHSVREETPHSLRKDVIRPYDFQSKAVLSTATEPIGLIVSPTGTGKTVIIANLIASMQMPTYVLVTDVVLLDQMQQALQRYFDQPIGIIGDGEFDLQNITVSTIQSLLSITRAKSMGSAEKRRAVVEHVKSTGMVISDEAHLYDSDGVAEVMPLFNETHHFYGMSATPYGWAEKAEKKQNIELEQHFGQVIYDCRNLDFVDIGLKVPVLVNVLNRDAVRSEYKTHTKRGRYGKVEIDWTKNYRECLETEILKNDQYHADIAQYVFNLMAQGKSSFVHAAHSIEFGNRIVSLIPGAVLVNGSTPRAQRRDVYDAMRKKELLTLVSDVGGTGLDIPSLDAMILASDLKDVRQLVGRVARKPYGGTKDYGLVADVRTRTQFLEKHHSVRVSQYKHEGYPVVG